MIAFPGVRHRNPGDRDVHRRGLVVRGILLRGYDGGHAGLATDVDLYRGRRRFGVAAVLVGSEVKVLPAVVGRAGHAGNAAPQAPPGPPRWARGDRDGH
jgi:hypothetical protein